MCPQDLALLTPLEADLLRDLQMIDSNSVWGYSIKRCLKHISAFGFRNLVCELKSQSDDAPDVMKNILGETAHQKLLSL
jgi:hypothetical protein